MTKPLSGRIALVTGASRGIGFAIAKALARQGAHIVATARTPGGLEELDDAIRAEMLVCVSHYLPPPPPIRPWRFFGSVIRPMSSMPADRSSSMVSMTAE